MRSQVITQIVLVVVAVAIVVFVVKPKLAEIGDSQAEARSYEQAIERATQYNNKLSELINKAKNFSRADILALQTYLPEEVDVLQVSRDIESIVTNSGLLLENVEVSSGDDLVTSVVENNSNAVITDPALDPTSTGLIDPDGAGSLMSSAGLLDEARRNLVSRQFKFTALGTYGQFKQLMMGLEGNNYPLRIIEMSFETVSDSDLTEYSFTVETYALTKTDLTNQTNQNTAI